MHFETRLWQFTQGVRLRMVCTVLIGLVATCCGIARLALLGWLIGRIFAGDSLQELLWPVLAVALVIVIRGALEHWRALVAHTTAARVQLRLRQRLFEKMTELGPGYVGQQRSGDVTISLVDGVEQLEVYFGQYLPQLTVSLLTPLLIFAGVAWLDLPVALVMLTFALLALFAPAIWHQLDSRKSLERRVAYGAFAAELLDSIQGLATLKAFGQSRPRAETLAVRARELFRSTMWVLATNSLGRGITDSSIAIGAATALGLGAYRVADGAMELPTLLVILMLGVEVYRPMRDLRSVLHQGMVGLSAAKGIYALLDGVPAVQDADEGSMPARIAPEIVFDHVTFHYPGSRRITHDHLSFTVQAGERVGIVGPSGCGKSSIVRLLLRLYDPDAGDIRIGGYPIRELRFAALRRQIAVVSQDTYLFHGSIEENIRMGRPDASHDDIVAAATVANIHSFIMSLPDGYQTLIGEKGIKLSGGQRQRVAIARAVLRDAPILVLDEALSAVDAENEAIIQEALDRLMAERTVLILAHRLSSVIDCDRILVLDQGHIVESGTHQELMALGGVYHRLMAEQVRDTAGYTANGQPTNGQRKAAEDRAIGVDLPGWQVDRPTEGILQAEGMTWPQVVRELMKLIVPWKGKLTLTFLFGVLRVVGFIGVGVLSALVILALKTGQPFSGYLWGLAAVAPLAGILHWLESWMAHDMAFRLLAEMRIDYFRKLDQLAPAYLVRRRTGDLMSVATQDIELVEYFFAHTIAPACVAVLAPTVVLLVLAAHSPWLAVTLIPFLAMVGLSPLAMRHRVDELGSQAREAAGELNAHAVDSVQGLTEIIAFQHEQRRGAALYALGQRHIALRLPFFRQLTLQQSLLEIMTGLGGLAIVAVGGALVAHGQIEAGTLPLLTILSLSAFLPVSEIAQIGRQLADTMGATRRVYAIRAEQVMVEDGPGVPHAAQTHEASLVLEDLSFAYPGMHRAALAHVTLTIPSGHTVALVGTSGAGKTTTAQLLMRFWDPQSGRVLLNGHDLRQYTLDDVRARVALVAQDTYLFNDTLRQNILIAKPQASEAELQQAVHHASLDDLVAALPEGLDSRVGERGMSLSGGQRQRVAIARAFLKDAPILILDEATSHLDAINERAVRDALDRLQTDRTTIVIAHRLSTIRDADLIVVLDAGQVVETGTHDSLLAKGGLYAQLVQHQLSAAHDSAA
ncbi:MAG: ABC transporter ATP-binding protein [Candidatus Tectomicrobia bacterium]|uniref:ABC transporter ATP-binding protein n=1 Tax=Tectimicrobiota bacterium TaxID=2528274 RepID=A0A937W1V7_UNCTE|nr:ABC transporter ATP-binding protein [Candidatus Tectomicrobia bacterium]